MTPITTPPFTEGVRASLGAMLQSVLGSPHSNFYREWFRDTALLPSFPESLDEWQKLPLITRKDITKASLWERCFVPRSEVMMVRNTTGTTEKKPLLTPRKTFGDYSAMPALAGVKRQLAFFTMWYSTEELRRGRGALFVNGVYPQSPNDFKLAATMARSINADSIACSPLLALMLAPHLREAGVIDRITAIEFSGDRCTDAQRDTILQLYNNPKIYQNYSASEWAGIYGVPCSYTIEHRLLSFHIVDDMLFSEFVDPDTGKAKDVRESAELVISSLTADQPFPLVRYRTNDLVKVEEENCTCERGGPRFQILGRANSDRIRFLLGEFSMTEIEKVLGKIPDVDPQDYEVHYSEHRVYEGKLRPQMHLKVLLKKPSADLAKIAERVANLLPHAGQDTYASLVDKGFVEPLIVSELKEPVVSASGKRTRLFKY